MFATPQTITLTNGQLILSNTTTAEIISGPGANVLTVSGNFTQGSSATLQMGLGGSTAGSGYSQLQVSGSASLAGTLAAVTLGGYSPPSGTTFQLITYDSHTGTFSSINGAGSSMTISPTVSRSSCQMNFVWRSNQRL